MWISEGGMQFRKQPQKLNSTINKNYSASVQFTPRLLQAYSFNPSHPETTTEQQWTEPPSESNPLYAHSQHRDDRDSAYVPRIALNEQTIAWNNIAIIVPTLTSQPLYFAYVIREYTCRR